MKNRDSVYTGDYGSTIRDDAMIIALLSEADSNADQRYGKLQALSAEIQNNRYFSTQESNALYLAGRQYINQSEKPWSALINGQAPAVSRDSALRETLTAVQLNNGISVANRGDAELFGRVNITGYPLQAPHPSSEVLKIKRTYMDLNGNPISIDRLSSGDRWLSVWIFRLTATCRMRWWWICYRPVWSWKTRTWRQPVQVWRTVRRTAEAIRDMQQANIRHTEYRDDRFVSRWPWKSTAR